ncbi:hypothetical protein SEA_LABELLE_45 [Mycobacterium phage Labelle]|nr:hypothetical protein SEA_LABELLE_45 [Mycobacterium phage Labelle]
MHPRTRVPQSTELRSPSGELIGDERQKIYIAALEKQIVRLSIRDVQFRSALEAATGRPYDSFDPRGMSYEDICEVIASDLARGLNLSIQEARSLVQENSQTANPSQMEKSI